LSNIFNKMGVGSRTEAVMLGLRQGLITLDDTL
jgi:DNA-binding NarL/FixJ family response regulator